MATHMADAARAWLDLLDHHQREQAAWPFPADDERRLWFYTPTDHGGLPLGAMDAAQQQAAMRLLRAGLSEAAVRHGDHDHRARERARRRRAVALDVRPRSRP